jgi:hypothetical protein
VWAYFPHLGVVPNKREMPAPRLEKVSQKNIQAIQVILT